MVGELNILSGSQGSQLFAVRQTQNALNDAQNRLSTGLRVDSALDNPQNYFTSLSLSSRASNLGRVLDNISQSVTALQATENARSTVNNLIGEVASTTNQARASLRENQDDIGNIILADNPVVYFRLNETSGTTATNLGSAGASLNGTYQGGVSLDAGGLSFNLSDYSASFDGNNDRVAIPNSPLINTSAVVERTVELTFQADTLGGKQVLFEEGGGTNAIALYLDDDRIFYAARDAGDFGPFNISAEIEAGKTYQAAFVFDSNAGTFTGYLDGEVVGVGSVTQPLSAHSGAVALGRNAGGTFFADGANGGNGEYFEGRLADFALYNSALSQSDLQSRVDNLQIKQAEFFQGEVENLLTQLDGLIDDATIQGTNLLKGGSLKTDFSLNGASSLTTQGVDFTSSGLGFSNLNFDSFSNIDKSINEFNIAESKIQDFSSGLSNDLNIIETRRNFTEDTINNLQGGSDDLTLSDANEDGAEILALQARQALQITTLNLSTQGTNIGDLLSVNPLLSGGST